MSFWTTTGWGSITPGLGKTIVAFGSGTPPPPGSTGGEVTTPSDGPEPGSLPAPLPSAGLGEAAGGVDGVGDGAVVAPAVQPTAASVAPMVRTRTAAMPGRRGRGVLMAPRRASADGGSRPGDG